MTPFFTFGKNASTAKEEYFVILLKGVVLSRIVRYKYAVYNFDINQDGYMDFYAFRDEHHTFECNNQINNIFFGNGDGTFRRPSVKEQSGIFGNYGCEIQSYFFEFEGEAYRAFFTHKYSKSFSGSRAVYVGVERIATKTE